MRRRLEVMRWGARNIWLLHHLVWKAGDERAGWWLQLQWLPSRWNLGLGAVIGDGDIGLYVRIGPVWVDAGYGALGAR